jgi:hypothetical protein
LPHPDPPSGRGSRWDTVRNGIDNPAGEELTQIRLAAEISLDKQSDRMRDALPDIGLQIIYDREISHFHDAYGFTTSLTVTDPALFLLKLQRRIGWVHCHLQGALTQRYRIAVEPILDQLDSLQPQTRSEEKGKLLGNIQSLSGRYCAAATESIQEHLKTGKQQIFIHTWRARMLACASARIAGAIEAPPEPLAPQKTSEEIRLQRCSFKDLDRISIDRRRWRSCAQRCIPRNVAGRIRGDRLPRRPGRRPF